MKESIYKIASNYKNGNTGTYIINSKDMDSCKCKLLFEYSVPKAMRIYPQKNVCIGSQFDLFKIKETLPKNLNNEDFLKDFRKKEAIEVAERVVSSLNTILKDSIYNDVYFETGYSKSLLSKLRRLYYYKKIVDADTKDFELSFLKRKKIKGLPLFCAPKLAEAHNQATDLPFFGVGGMNVFAIFLINNACKTITHGLNIHFSILRK